MVDVRVILLCNVDSRVVEVESTQGENLKCFEKMPIYFHTKFVDCNYSYSIGKYDVSVQFFSTLFTWMF